LGGVDFVVVVVVVVVGDESLFFLSLSEGDFDVAFLVSVTLMISGESPTKSYLEYLFISSLLGVRDSSFESLKSSALLAPPPSPLSPSSLGMDGP